MSKLIYKEVKVELCHGDKAVTVERMKELLGWTVVTDKNEKKVCVGGSMGLW